MDTAENKNKGTEQEDDQWCECFHMDSDLRRHTELRTNKKNSPDQSTILDRQSKKKSCRIRKGRDKQRQRDIEHLQAILPPDQLGIIAGVHVPAQVLVEINQAIVEEDIPLRVRMRERETTQPHQLRFSLYPTGVLKNNKKQGCISAKNLVHCLLANQLPHDN